MFKKSANKTKKVTAATANIEKKSVPTKNLKGKEIQEKCPAMPPTLIKDKHLQTNVAIDDTFSKVASTGTLNPLMKKPIYMSKKTSSCSTVISTLAPEPLVVSAPVSNMSQDMDTDVYNVDVYGEEEFGPEPEANKKKKKRVRKKQKGDIILTFGRDQHRENVVPLVKSLKNLKTPAQARPKRKPLKLVNYTNFLPCKPQPAIVVHPPSKAIVINPEKPPISGELINEDHSTGFTRDCDDFFPTFDEMATSYPEPLPEDGGNDDNESVVANAGGTPSTAVSAKKYLTPEVPKKVSKNQGGNVSTPRPPSPEKTTEELVRICFGFDTDESEVEESLLGGISPVKGTGGGGLACANRNSYGSILSPSTSVMCSSRISTAIQSVQKGRPAPALANKHPTEKPWRLVLPQTKKPMTLKESMARKKHLADVQKKREEQNRKRKPEVIDMSKEVSQSEEFGFMSEVESSTDVTNNREETEMICNPGSERAVEGEDAVQLSSVAGLATVTKIPPPPLKGSKTKQPTIHEAMSKGATKKKKTSEA